MLHNQQSKIRVLLISPADMVSPLGQIAKFPDPGSVSIAGNLEKSISEVYVTNLVSFNGNIGNYVTNLLRELKPNLVGIGGMSFQYSSMERLASIVKAYDRNISTLLGGYHATLAYSDINPRLSCFDLICRGEGEGTTKIVVERLYENITRPNFEGVTGLSYRKDGEFIHNETRDLLNLNTLRAPDRSVRLLKGFKAFGLPMEVVETSRGCKKGCLPCSINQFYGPIYREFPIERVIEEIDYVKNKGAKIIAFTDDNITMNMARFEKLLIKIIKTKNNDIKYWLQLRADAISNHHGIIELMKDAGIMLVYLGLESPKEDNLKTYGKSGTKRFGEIAVRRLKKANIVTWVGYVVGFPNDTAQDIWDVYKYSLKIHADRSTFSILTPFPGTQIRKELDSQGLITNHHDLSLYTLNDANIRTKHLSSQQLQTIVEKMCLKQNISPKHWYKNNIWKYPDLWKFALTYFGQSVWCSLRNFTHKYNTYLKV